MQQAAPVARQATTPAESGVERGGGAPPSNRITLFDYFRALVRDPAALLALCFVVLVIGSAIGANFVAPHDPYAQSIRMRNRPPGTAALEPGAPPHIMGTDALGRDTFSRLIYGARISLAVGFATVLISGTLGVILGLIAGYYRGSIEDLIMRIVDLQMSLPSLLLALFVLFIFGPGFQNLIMVMVITRWMVYARITRGMMLSLRQLAYVEAARALGCSDRRIILGHMLPNLLSPILVLGTLEIATMMLSLAALDFLGLGIQPPDSSWGLMLAQGREYITAAWWQVTFPGLAILLTALGFNILATWVRAVTDPINSWRWLRGSRRRAAPAIAPSA